MHRRIRIFLITSACLFVTAPVLAQIEEIVVTGTKRGAVDAQDVPIAISSVGGEYLDDVGADEFLSFSRKLGIQTDDAGPGEKRFIIRGLSADGTSTVGLYYDEIPTSGFGPQGAGDGQPDFRVMDLERVEILRGPQGTLYGSGSVGGTIRYVTNKPNLQEFEGSIAVDYGDVSQGGGDRWSVEGMLDIPLVEDKLGLRVNGFTSEADGLTRNTFVEIDGTDERESTGGRAILRWAPNDVVTATASYWTQESDVGDRTEYNTACDPAVNACFLDRADGGISPPTAAPVSSTSSNHISTQGTTTPFSEEMDIFGLNITVDTNNGTLTSSTSYFDRYAETAFDSSDFALGFFGDPESVFPVSSDQDTQLFSQEITWASNLDGPFNFVVGGFYQDREELFDQRGVMSVPTPGASGRDLINNPVPSFVVMNFLPPPLQDGVLFHTLFDRDFTNTALFGEINWQVTDRFAVDAGLRWFELDTTLQEIKLKNPDLTFFAFGAPLGPDRPPATNDKFDDVIVKLTGSFEFNENVMGYATYSEGFREGGVNPLRTAVNLPAGFGPDYVDNYEAGLKTTLADGQLIANFAYFFMEWDNLQVNVDDPTGLFGLFLNLEEGADINGLELETIWVPSAIEGLEVQFGAQWTDAEFNQDIPGLDDMGNLIPGDPIDDAIAGDPLPNVSDWTLSGSVQYSFSAFGGRDSFVLVDWSYTGDSYSELSPRDPFGMDVGDFHLFNLRFGITGDDAGGWSATLYGRNLLDEDTPFRFDNRAGLVSPSNGPTVISAYPRTIGINFRKDF